MAKPFIVWIGLRRTLGRPGLIFGLWLLSLSAAALSALPAGLALYLGLEDRPAAYALAGGEADALWGEVLSPSGGLATLVPLAASGALIGGFLYWLVQTLLSGGLVAALLRPGHPAYAPPGRVLTRAAETGGAMLRLELIFIAALRLPLLFAAAAVAYLLAYRQNFFDGTAQAIFVRYAPLCLVTLVLWSAASVILHYARAYCLAKPPGDGSTVAIVFRAVQLASETRSRLAATLGLGLLSAAGYGLLFIAGWRTAARLDHALLIGLALLIRQGCAVARTVLGLSIMAAATEVWHGSEASFPPE